MQTPKEGVTEREHGANFLKFQSQGLCYYFYRAVVRVYICFVCMCVLCACPDRVICSFWLKWYPRRRARDRSRRGSCVPTGTAPGSEMPSPPWAIKEKEACPAAINKVLCVMSVVLRKTFSPAWITTAQMDHHPAVLEIIAQWGCDLFAHNYHCWTTTNY